MSSMSTSKAVQVLEKSSLNTPEFMQAYQMLAQSLKDEIKYATDGMNKAKKNLAASGEAKATTEGDLSVTTKDLDEDVNFLAPGLYDRC